MFFSFVGEKKKNKKIKQKNRKNIRNKSLHIKSPWDPFVIRHASLPLDTWIWTEGGSDSLPAGRGSASCSSSDTGGDEEEDEDEDKEDEDDEDFRFSLLLDFLSPSLLSSLSPSRSSSVPGGRLWLEDLLEDWGRGEATGERGEDDFVDFLPELREREPLDEALPDSLVDPLGVERGDEWADDGLGGEIERDLGGETGGMSGSFTRGRSDRVSDGRLFASCCRSCCCCSWSCCVWLNCCMSNCSCWSFCFFKRSFCWFWSRFCSSWISFCLFKIQFEIHHYEYANWPLFFFNSCYQGQLNPCKGRVDGKELSLVLKNKTTKPNKGKTWHETCFRFASGYSSYQCYQYNWKFKANTSLSFMNF